MLDGLAIGGVPGSADAARTAGDRLPGRTRDGVGDGDGDAGGDAGGDTDADCTGADGVVAPGCDTWSARVVDGSSSQHASSVSARPVTAVDTVIDSRCSRV